MRQQRYNIVDSYSVYFIDRLLRRLIFCKKNKKCPTRFLNLCRTEQMVISNCGLVKQTAN